MIKKQQKIGINELFDKLNDSLKLNVKQNKKEKINQHLSEAQKAVSKILAYDKLTGELEKFASAANKTLKLSISKIKDEENIVLLVRMMAFILVILEKEKFIKINY